MIVLARKISNFTEKNKIFEKSKRANFAIYNFKIDNIILKNLIENKSIFFEITNNMFDIIKIYDLNIFQGPLIEITYRGVKEFNIKKINKHEFKKKYKFIQFSSI